MPARDLTPAEVRQKEFLKKAEMLSAVNLGTYEIHSRIALLWLQLWQDLDAPEVVAEAPATVPAVISYDWARVTASEWLGDYMTKKAEDDGLAIKKKLKWLRNIAALPANNWTGKWEAGPVTIPINELSGYINHAFNLCMGFDMRLCDWRVIVTFTSPNIWARTKLEDFVLRNGDENAETLRMLQLCGTRDIRTRIPVHVESFTTEFVRYMREHMKYKWSTPTAYFEWRKAFIEGLKIASRMAPGR